jgi:glycosyltransferase involved in cell wall biosynthesis
MPEVSVIIPAYNHEKYIAQSIESVLSQTLQDIEIIIIDDGSTDNTPKIIKNFASQYPEKINCILHKVNQRPENISNQGIKLAKGKYIAWNDSDDFWYPNKLEKQIAIFRRKPNIELVYSYGVNIIESKTRYRSAINANDLELDVFKQLFRSAFFMKVSMVARKEIYDKISWGNKKYIYCGDYEWMLRVAAAGYTFDCVPEVLVGHRIHDTNETKDIVTAQLNTKDMLQDVANTYKDLVILKNINVQQRLSVCDLRIARHYFAKGENKLCREYILKILKFSPSLLFSERALLPITFLSLIPKLIRNIFKHIKPFNKLFLAS